MNISERIKQAASVNIFALAQNKNAFVGHPFYFDYSTVNVLIADARKKSIGGIPQGTFLLAFYDNEENEKEAVLLRALKPTKLPTDQEVIQSMIEYYKDNLKVSGDSSQLDEYTRYEFSFSGLECRVLGTFYQNRNENLVFGADLENFYSAHNYSVYKPYGTILEKIVNFREGDSIPGQDPDVKVGIVRYSSSKRFQEKTKDIDEVPFYVSPIDFLGKRTALFGMTRTGKSNTVKKIIQATAQINEVATLDLKTSIQSIGTLLVVDANPTNPFTEGNKPKYPVGQIIFDIAGEYANANLQDEGTAIFDMYQDKVTRFSIMDKPGFKVMKTNFYEDIEAGFELLKVLLVDDTARFVTAFRTIDFMLPEERKKDQAFMTRYKRKIAAYKCCLYLAGFPIKSNFIEFPGENTTLNPLASGINPAKGITFEQAEIWFNSVWNAIGDNHRFFETYKDEHEGRDWADEDLKALMTMISRRWRNTGAVRRADCAGYNILRPALELHTNSVAKPFVTEIVELLRVGQIVIADLSQGDPEIIRLYSEKICQHLFSETMVHFIKNEPNNFVQMYFEEAHNLFPKKDDKNLSQIYPRLAKEGAKLNIGLVYATQEVSSISANILKNTQNWFVAHLNNDDELKEVEKYYDFEDFTESLSRFSSSTDKGFIRIKTYSNPYIVPVQVDRFAVPPR
jgi:hypothetical protein